MSTFNRFEDIKAWQSARFLTREVYLLTKNGELARDYGFKDQIRRASVAVMANIAEGFERGGNDEFIQFLSIAKASSAEVRSHLYVAMDANYISKEIFGKLTSEAEKMSKMINGLMTYLIESDKKGYKKDKKLKSKRSKVGGEQ